MASKHLKRCSMSYVTKELQIKTTVRFPYTPIEWPKSKTLTPPNAGCGEIGALIHYWWECKMVQPFWKTV